MRFVHCADIHLDSPMRGLAAYDGAPVAEIRAATRRALENLVDLCGEERVDFLIVAGDLFDGDWRDFNTGLFFVKQMARLRAQGIPVFVALGNHDAEGQLDRRLPLPDNVRVFRSKRPETHGLEPLGVSLHGQSFATREVSDNLALGYPPPVPGHFNVGVLHTALGGRPGHEPYAPCALEQLVARGYDYWALGHVHRREIVHEHPHVVFPGNLQGRHVKETGEKGCALVTVEDRRVVELEHRTIDVVRWEQLEVDASGTEDRDEALARARAALDASVRRAAGRVVAARVVLTGACRSHEALLRSREQLTQEIRATATDRGQGLLWVEGALVATRALDGPARAAPADEATLEILRAAAAMAEDEGEIAFLLDGLAQLRAKLPPEVSEGEDGLALDGPDDVRRRLPEVERLLAERLLTGAPR